MEKTLASVFRTRPQYTQDQKLVDFNLGLKAKNKRLADITTRLVELVLSNLEPKIEDMVDSLSQRLSRSAK